MALRLEVCRENVREMREMRSWKKKNSQRAVQTQQPASRVYLVKLLSLHCIFKWVCVLGYSCAVYIYMCVCGWTDGCVCVCVWKGSRDGERSGRSNSRVLERLILCIDVDGICFAEWRNCEGEFAERRDMRQGQGVKLHVHCKKKYVYN